MNRRNVLGMTAIAVLGFALLPTSLFAQQPTLKEQLVGVWTAVSWEQLNKDGSKLQRFGANPRGMNVFDASGYFFVMFARPDLPKLASRNPMRTTPDESKAIVEGTIAYYGKYTVDEKSKAIILHIEASTLPNQIGSQQRRTVDFVTADELRVSNTTTFTGEMINYVVKRTSTSAVN